MASIEYRASGPRVVWRLNRPGDPQHQKKQPLECGDEGTAVEAKRIVDAHRGRLTRDEAELLVLGPSERADIGPAAPTFGEWVEKWLPNKTGISPRTRGDYRKMLAYRILPTQEEAGQPTRAVAGYRHLPIDGFVPGDIMRFVRAMQNEGRSIGTITKHFAVVSSAFAAAVRDKIIDENPCDGTDFRWDQVEHDDTGEEEHVYLTPVEYGIFYRHLPDAYKPFVKMLVSTGVRFGEGTALQRCDLIPQTRREPSPRLWIRRAWKKDENGRYYLGTTKGRQRRKNKVDNDLWELLLECAKDKLPEDLIFTAPRGGRVEYQNFVNRVWNPAIVQAMRCDRHPPADRAVQLDNFGGKCGDHGGISAKTKAPCRRSVLPGLDRCALHAGPAPNAVSECDCPDVLHRRPSPHDLRHTCVSWMLADPTVAPLYVSRYVGHKSMEVTDKVYAGMMPSGEGAAVSAIAEARGQAELHLWGPAPVPAPAG